MGNQFVIVYIIAILLLISYIYYENQNNEVTYVESSVDGKKYLVRNLLDKQEAADLLSKIKTRLVKLVDYLEKDYPSDKPVKRLVSKYRPDSISESSPDSKYTSYSVNKGEKIVFCIRSRNSEQKLVDENTMMFVALHELAHVMTVSIGHTEEFWDNFRFLLKNALKRKLYKKQDFKNKPQEYCGTQITDSPLKD